MKQQFGGLVGTLVENAHIIWIKISGSQKRRLKIAELLIFAFFWTLMNNNMQYTFVEKGYQQDVKDGFVIWVKDSYYREAYKQLEDKLDDEIEAFNYELIDGYGK